jgi:sugar phosphate isomerase/epimerase
VKAHADEKHIELLVGTWSICPTSVEFRDTWGTADEHLALGIRVAAALGSRIIRVILGSHRDRLTPGGIDARITDTVKVLKRARTRCLDAGVKVAVENHAGDMHSLELVRLIEDAGPEFVGANMDSGNAVWALEDPLENLENLGRHALATSLRDAVAWETDDGALLQWTAMGEGQIDWKRYFARFAELCPETAVNIETISGRNFAIPYRTEAFQKAWPAGRPEGFDRFLAFLQRGKPRPEHQQPPNTDPATADRQYQRAELQRSMAWCREFGLGRRADET